MKTKKEIAYRIAELLADERLHYPTATVFENAPLALIQLSGETELKTLCWILGIPMPQLRPEKKV